VTIGVGKEYIDYNGISRSYNEAASALAYRYTLGGDRFILISDIEPNRQTIKAFDRLQETRLMDAIKSGNPAQINELTEYMFLPNETEDLHACRVYALSVMVSIALEAERLGLVSDVFLSGADINSFFLERSSKNILKKVREACLSLSQMIGNQQNSSQRSVFEKTVRLIEEHISDVDLSADRICEALHFSPSYFRTLFKKETGMSFGAYLTQIRMEKAKQLLFETNEKGYLIAKKVGFSDPHYFSFCFKKYFHVTPKEMREKGRGC
jgi:two-component system response regulator YesN